jgi:solute:Na+ symporter, SSS family
MFVNNTEDYLHIGRKLLFAIATFFANLFGSENIFGSSSEYAERGLIAVVRDPFSTGLCLMLA